MSEETKKCPFCGEEVLAIAIKCKHCQSMLNGSEAGQINANTLSPEPVKTPIATAEKIDNYFFTIAGFPLALIAIFFAGWVYVWSCSIPFIFWLMPFFYGGAAGVCMFFMAICFFRTDDIGVLVFGGIAAAAVAYYANWVWFVYDVFDQFIMSPGELWERIKIIQMARSIDVDTFAGSKRGIVTFEDGVLVLAWLLEFVMICGGVAAGFYYMIFEEGFFFCPGCKRWNEIKSKPYKLASDKPEYELTSIEAIMQMTTPEDENSDHYMVTVFECPYCRTGSFSLTACKAILRDGKYEFKKRKLLSKVACSTDKIRELKEFIEEKGIRVKKS